MCLSFHESLIPYLTFLWGGTRGSLVCWSLPPVFMCCVVLLCLDFLFPMRCCVRPVVTPTVMVCRMNKLEIRDYLEKIYDVKVAHVATLNQQGACMRLSVYLMKCVCACACICVCVIVVMDAFLWCVCLVGCVRCIDWLMSSLY